MPRNSAGTATRVNPPGSTGYVSGTVISPSVVNGEINDIYSMMTDSGTVANLSKTVSNVATLKLQLKTGNGFCYTAGYTTSGDGGSGGYWLDLSDTTSADNRGTIIVANDGGRWKLRNDRTVSVLQFGANKTGLVDATPAFINAIAYFKAVGGGVLYVPDGTYLLTATLTVDFRDFRIMGNGMFSSVLTRASSYGDTILFTGNVTTGVRILDSGISGMTIRNTGAMTSGAQIHVIGATRMVIQNIFIDNGHTGMRLAGLTDSYITSVNIVTINLFGAASLSSRYVDFAIAPATFSHPSCGDIFMSNCNFRGNVAGTVVEYGIHIQGGDGIFVSNSHIGDTTSANVLLTHLTAENTNLIFFDNTMFDECEGYGVMFNGAASPSTARDIKFSNCEFSGGGNGLSGIATSNDADFESVLFIGCTVRWFRRVGVLLQSPDCYGFAFQQCDVRGNSYEGSGLYPAYSVANGLKGFSIQGGKAGGALNGSGVGLTNYGLLVGGTTDEYIVQGVDFTDNVTDPMQFGSVGINTLVGNNAMFGYNIDIASAGTISLKAGFQFLRITGNTNIQTINGSYVGRIVILNFQGTPNVQETGNIKLAGAFKATVGSSLTLYYDGTIWYEQSRAIV